MQLQHTFCKIESLCGRALLLLKATGICIAGSQRQAIVLRDPLCTNCVWLGNFLHGKFHSVRLWLFIRRETKHTLTRDIVAAAPKPYMRLWFFYADKCVCVQYSGLEVYNIFLGGKSPFYSTCLEKTPNSFTVMRPFICLSLKKYNCFNNVE